MRCWGFDYAVRVTRTGELVPLLLGDVNDVGHLVVLLGFVGKGVPVLSRRLGSGVPSVIDGMRR